MDNRKSTFCASFHCPTPLSIERKRKLREMQQIEPTLGQANEEQVAGPISKSGHQKSGAPERSNLIFVSQ